jgi:Mg2+ and Co2+ transporter CorA
MESYIPPEWTTDIISEYEYTYDCIGDMEKELASLTDNVNGIISRRNEQISIVLSLVSTVFLPLTFIAGVFGMNFSNGGILVYILNMRNGTNVFWIGCASCVLYCLYVFVAKV